VYPTVKSGSAATLSPTLFIAVKALAPAKLAPIADSTATFSLGAHSDIISLCGAIFSNISVLGVPG